MEDNPDLTLQVGEVHPAARTAFAYVKSHITPMLIEAFASTALSGNRLANICTETLRRIMNGEPVSDRYLLGLAWTMMEMDLTRKLNEKETKKKKVSKASSSSVGNNTKNSH